MKIMVVGDIHGFWSSFNRMIRIDKPNLILQCGDFGYWPNHLNFNPEPMKSKIYFCDGNHEDHWALKNIDNYEIKPNVFYMKRGSTLRLPDGRNVLFIGGANSIDKHVRKFGIDWFPEEVISNKDVYELPDEKIDIVISHTCPTEFYEVIEPKLRFTHDDNDPSRAALSYVLEKYRPSLWYFAHFHLYYTGFIKDCKWFALNQCALKGWKKVLLK